jgi:hypothetical protein
MLKVLVPCEKCSWYKIVRMIFWKGWRSPTPLKPKIHCFLVGRTGSYRFYFLRNLTLLPLKVLMWWALGFFTYSSIKDHFTSIVGIEGNKSYNCQSLQLKNNGFWIWGRLATANPSKISFSQFWTMSTFHMARALLTETMLTYNWSEMLFNWWICEKAKCSWHEHF